MSRRDNLAEESVLVGEVVHHQAGSTPAADATDRIVVLSNPFCPNCILAAAKIAAFVAAASRVLEAMPAVYSTTVDNVPERS